MELLAEVERRTKAAREEELRRQSQWRADDIKRQQAIEALYEKRHQELREDQEKFQKSAQTHGWGTTAFNGLVNLACAIVGGVVGSWLASK